MSSGLTTHQPMRVICVLLKVIVSVVNREIYNCKQEGLFYGHDTFNSLHQTARLFRHIQDRYDNELRSPSIQSKYGNNDNNDNNNKNACMYMHHACMYAHKHTRPYARTHLCPYVTVYDAGRQAGMNAHTYACVSMYDMNECLIACV